MPFVPPHPLFPRSRPSPRSTRSAPWRLCAAAAPQPPRPSTSLDSLLAHLRSTYRPAVIPSSPTVHLVGTGPGDPGLLTLNALSLMQSADVVLYDRLVSPQILTYVNRDATMIYVGKEAGFHTRTQADIHLLLRHFSEAGKVVVRLKGGDPFIFGRGGEEKEYLEEWGVEVETVPGITAAAGIAAGLGIPLTMRGVADSVRFLTGHLKESGLMDVGEVQRGTTLVVYMGLGMLEELVKVFEKGGMACDVPCAAIEKGTTKDQRVVVARLDGLVQRVRNEGLKSPTLFIVGDVVRLASVWKEQMGERKGAKVGAESR